MGKHVTIHAASPRDAALAMPAAFDRRGIEEAVETIIDRLNYTDSDPDLKDSEGLMPGHLPIDWRGRLLFDTRALPTEDDEPADEDSCAAGEDQGSRLVLRGDMNEEAV